MQIGLDAVRATAREVRAAFLEMRAEPYRGAKNIFPAVWCEWASVALAEMLTARGFDEWTFVENKLPDSPSAMRGSSCGIRNGAMVFTIDTTLDQFAKFDHWYMGKAPTPALEKFSRSIYVGLWRG